MTELTVEQQKLILRPYAAGADLRTISADTGIDHDAVSELVSSLAFQRTRAAERLRQIDAAGPGLPVITVRTDPAAIIAAGEAAGGRFATAAARIRRQVAALSDELSRNGEVIAADRRVEQLRRELAEATEKARLLKSGKAVVDPKVIRKWATQQGIPCPPVGPVPAPVRAAYEKRGAR